MWSSNNKTVFINHAKLIWCEWNRIFFLIQKSHLKFWQAWDRTTFDPKNAKYRSCIEVRSTFSLSINCEKNSHFTCLAWNSKPTYWVQQIGFEPCKLIFNDLSPWVEWTSSLEIPSKFCFLFSVLRVTLIGRASLCGCENLYFALWTMRAACCNLIFYQNWFIGRFVFEERCKW